MDEEVPRRQRGVLQWLCTNAWADLAADTSISAGTSGTGITKASILNAQKLIRWAHVQIDVKVMAQVTVMGMVSITRCNEEAR